MRMKMLLAFSLILLLQNVKSQTPDSPCDSIIKIGLGLYQQQNYKEAIPAFETGLRICSKDTGMEKIDYFIMLSYLSIMYYEVGNLDSTIRIGEAAIDFFEKTGYIGNQVYSGQMIRLALAYSRQGKYKPAIADFKKAIPYYEKKFGLASTQYLLYSMELANCFGAISDFTESMAINRKVKNIIEVELSKENQMYVAVITNMGNNFVHLSQFDSALAYHTEALLLREKIIW